MSDAPTGHPHGEPEEGPILEGQTEGSAEPEGAPHRVIGTPPPAQSRMLLAETAAGTADGQPAVRERELPADPQDMDDAKRAERIVAACFLLAMLAGIAFIAAYVIFEPHSPTRVLHSNLALGLTMGLTFLLLGAGATIWVRRLMPHVELSEPRHPLRSDEADREAFVETFKEGADASQFVKRPILRRTLIAATVPAAIAPVVLLRDLGPLPRTSLDHTVWRNGLRLSNYGVNTPIRPGDFSSPGGMITVVPVGYQDNFNALAKAACIIIKFAPDEVVYTDKPYPVDGYTVRNWTVD